MLNSRLLSTLAIPSICSHSAETNVSSLEEYLSHQWYVNLGSYVRSRSSSQRERCE